MRQARMTEQVRVLAPRRVGPLHRVRDLVDHREQLAFFGRKLVEKRYIRTWLGTAWIPLRPALDLGLRGLLFGGVLTVSSAGKPYLVFLAVGMSCWMVFETTALWATRSLEVNRSVLRRFDVPLVVPLVAALAPAALEFFLYLGVGAVAVVAYTVGNGEVPLDVPGVGWRAAVALGLGGLGLLGLVFGLWSAPGVAGVRDIRFVFTYASGLWLYLTPVIYELDSVPSGVRAIAERNPATAPVEAFKHALLGTGAPPASSWVATGVAIVLIGVPGAWWFGRRELRATHHR